MRRILCALAVAALAAGCGGTAWNSSTAKSSQTTKVAAAAKAAQAVALAERPYVDAMTVSAHEDMMSDSGPMPTTAQVRCLATAIVHTFGKLAFVRVGLTPAELRASGSSIKDLPAPSLEQADALGAAIQRCHIAGMIAAGMVASLNVKSAATTACLTRQFERGIGARRFLALSALERPIDLAAAHSFVGVMAACVDLAALVLDQADLEIDATTRACMVDSLKREQAALVDFMAVTMVDDGTQTDTTELTETLDVALNRCRPGAQTGFTVPSD